MLFQCIDDAINWALFIGRRLAASIAISFNNRKLKKRHQYWLEFHRKTDEDWMFAIDYNKRKCNSAIEHGFIAQRSRQHPQTNKTTGPIQISNVIPSTNISKFTIFYRICPWFCLYWFLEFRPASNDRRPHRGQHLHLSIHRQTLAIEMLSAWLTVGSGELVKLMTQMVVSWWFSDITQNIFKNVIEPHET